MLFGIVGNDSALLEIRSERPFHRIRILAAFRMPGQENIVQRPGVFGHVAQRHPAVSLNHSRNTRSAPTIFTSGHCWPFPVPLWEPIISGVFRWIVKRIQTIKSTPCGLGLTSFQLLNQLLRLLVGEFRSVQSVPICCWWIPNESLKITFQHVFNFPQILQPFHVIIKCSQKLFNECCYCPHAVNVF